jgi:uncharacterized protein DUF992
MLANKLVSPLQLLSLISAAVLTAQPVVAASKVKLGLLTCTGGDGVGLIVGSKKYYECHYAPADGGPSDTYDGSVIKIGLDIGITGKTTMVWTVLAVEAPHRQHVLAGTYVGVSADASLGLGAGAKVLVGGSNKSITLQPLSVQGQNGVNLAVGVAGLKLR